MDALRERGSAGERSFTTLGQNQRPCEKQTKAGPAKSMIIAYQGARKPVDSLNTILLKKLRGQSPSGTDPLVVIALAGTVPVLLK